MEYFGKELEKRRLANAKAMKAFGVMVNSSTQHRPSVYRTIRSGGNVTIFTIGYEKRTGEELMFLLRDAGVEVLADIRENPVSRVADFRQSSLQALCQEAGILYESWTELGSTKVQRDRLKETGDLKTFQRQFRIHASRSLAEPLNRLAERAKIKSIALLCYERQHEDCHRSIVADLLADRLNANIEAI